MNRFYILWLSAVSLFIKDVIASPTIVAQTTWDLRDFEYFRPQVHSHSSVLDPEGLFTVYWTPDLEKEVVTWEIHAKTKGWIGFGFSPNGEMVGADMVTAWVKDDKLYLQDRYGEGNDMLKIDEKSDWTPLFAKENETHTILSVSRKIQTCDEHDVAITDEITRLVYAYGLEDPVNDIISLHDAHKGTRNAFVLLPFHKTALTSDVQTWKIDQTRTLPSDQTSMYWCHIEKVPNAKSKQHYIGYQMRYNLNVDKHLQEAVVYECHTKDGSPSEATFEKHVLADGFECYTPNMPDEFHLCDRILINWAMGSEGEMLPDHVGFPLGDDHGGATYLLFQAHYENMQLLNDIRVSWGMDIYYTEQYRQQEASVLALGHSMLFSLTIPPNVPEWNVTGHCSAACTFKGVPQGGVKVFNVFLHGHNLTKSMRLRHFRGNIELPLISQDRNYDPNFQQSRTLPTEISILPGDHLTVECTYDSTKRNQTTFSGWDSQSEMCQAFVNYYPRMEMSLCRSSPDPQMVQKALGIAPYSKIENYDEIILDTNLVDGKAYQQAVNEINWVTKDINQIDQEFTQGKHISKCIYNNGQSMEVIPSITKYPTITRPLVNIDLCVLDNMTRTAHYPEDKLRYTPESPTGNPHWVDSNHPENQTWYQSDSPHVPTIQNPHMADSEHNNMEHSGPDSTISPFESDPRKSAQSGQQGASSASCLNIGNYLIFIIFGLRYYFVI